MHSAQYYNICLSRYKEFWFIFRQWCLHKFYGRWFKLVERIQVKKSPDIKSPEINFLSGDFLTGDRLKTYSENRYKPSTEMYGTVLDYMVVPRSCS